MNELARRAGVAALLIAAAHSSALAQIEEEGGAKIDPKADEVVKKMTSHYADLEAVKCKIELAISITGGGEEMGGDQEFEATYDYAAQEPDHFALRLIEGDFGMTVVSDGETLYTHSPSDDIYMKAEAPEDFAALRDEIGMTTNISQAGEEGRLLIALMLDDGYDRLMEGVNELVLVGDEKVGEQAVHRVKLVRSESIDLDLFIAADGEPWLVKITPDVQKMTSSMGDPRKIDIQVALTDWSSEKADAELFAFSPPESATLFDPNEVPLDGRTLVDKPAPEVALATLGSDAQINLADHKGKDIVVLDFWATWCGPCVQGLPIMTEVTKSFADRNVVFYAVNLREKSDVVQKFMADKKWDFNVLMDAKGAVGKAFGVGGIPHSVIISKDGIIEAVHVGIPPQLDDLRKQLTGELEQLIANGKLE